MSAIMCSFFFFQAEDGIRDYKVTGVQTCALPISLWPMRSGELGRGSPTPIGPSARSSSSGPPESGRPSWHARSQIGRASCRERGEISVGAVSLKKKKKNHNKGNEEET